jgi:vacuolar-type H+-ATPase subunit E/Vma4
MSAARQAAFASREAALEIAISRLADVLQQVDEMEDYPEIGARLADLIDTLRNERNYLRVKLLLERDAGSGRSKG